MSPTEREIKWLKRKLSSSGPFAFTKLRRIFYGLLAEREELKAEIAKMQPVYFKAELSRLMEILDEKEAK